MLLVLLACAPGVLLSRDGREPLRTALYTASEGAPTSLLLSNSALLCELPDEDDPADVEAALARQQAGVTREGASLLYVELEAREGDLVGSYDVAPDVDLPEVRRMSVTWWHVVEAVVESREGVVISYAPGDEEGDLEYVSRLGSPATLEISADEDRLVGSFDLGVIDVSGRFEASYCSPDASLYAMLGI